MLVTKPSWFEIVGRQNGNLWLQVREGEDQGRRVSVPVIHSEYSIEKENQLESLSVGDLCKVTLHSDSETAPDWRVNDIEDIRRSRNQANRRAPSGLTSAQILD